MPVSAIDRTVSAWTSDSADDVLLASLEDAERVLVQVFNSSGNLRDPPRQIDEKDPVVDTGEEPEDAAYQTPDEEDATCRKASLRANEHQERQAPSLESIDRNVNTVEVVKKDGSYTVVLDGIAQPPIEVGNGPHRYWLPRFKEGVIQGDADKGTQRKRVVKPILFSMRLENFETPPSSCVVDAKQRVVNGGVLYMDNNTIKSSPITPFAVNDASANVTILPYPLVCTEAPYVAVNDFSKVLDAELRLKLDALDKGTKQELQSFYNIIVGASASDLGWGTAAFRATKGVLKVAGRLFGGAASVVGTAVKAGAAAETVVATSTAAQAAAVTIATTAGAGGVAAAGGAAYILWNYMRKSKPQEGADLTDEDYLKLIGQEREATKRQLVSAIEDGPVIHKITLPELTSMLYRIAESRANGSMMTETDHTLGMSVHDFIEKTWNREAALMQWLMFGQGARAGRDAYTGLYDSKEDAMHAAQFGDDAANAAPTFNTIGLQGMDPLTLANCRSEFTYVITIKEHDGTDGPTIILDPTRINGIDAAWIASGFTEQFYECKKAAQCLRSRLHRLPHVGRYMAGHDTLVSDTNNGVVVATDLDDAKRALLGRELEDAPGVSINPRTLKKRRQALEGKFSKAQKRQRAHLERIKRIKDTIAKAKKEYAEERAKQAPRQSTLRAKLRVIKQKEAELTQAFKEQESYDYEVFLMQNRRDRAADLEKKPRVFANLFDPEATYSRILSEVLGGQTFDYGDFQSEPLNDDDSTPDKADDGNDDAGVEEGEDSDEEEEVDLGFFQAFWYRNNASAISQRPRMRRHFKDARKAFASSCGVQKSDVDLDSSALIRFVEMLCPPAVGFRDQRFMRFAAFVVPPSPRSSFYFQNSNEYYVRLLPQVISFSRSLVSTFGSVTILQPATLSDKTFLTPNQSQKASNAVNQSRVALRNMTSVFPELLQSLTIYRDTHSHFCQTYHIRPDRSSADVKSVLYTPIETQHNALDMLSMSFVPSTITMGDVILANDAGGSLLYAMKDLVSGSSYGGVAALLSGMGLQTNPYSFLALASFAEILSHYILEHGTSSSAPNGVGFELQRYELVQSALQSGLRAARTIGQLLLDTYASNNSTKRRLDDKDIAFYCIPGMSRLRVVMRRIGILGDSSFEKSRALCTQVGRGLVKLGSTNKHDLSKFPFTCIQSSISAVPHAIRGIESYSSAIEIHLKAANLAHERCFYASSLLSRDQRSVLFVCVDSLYSRPVAAKAFQADRAKAIRVISGHSNKHSQKSWTAQAPPFENAFKLRVRLSQLRLDIASEQKEQRALNMDESEASVLRGLVDEMTRMTFNDLAYYDESNPSATFMIPFGLTAFGTTKDILHTKFETHPVWIEHLLSAATTTIIESPQLATVELNCSKTDVNGRLHHPHAIRVTKSSMHTVMYANVQVSDADLSDHDPSFNPHLKSFESFCERVGDGSDVYNVSGVLSEHYKLTMHNAERAFQVCMVLASGVSGHDASDKRLYANAMPPDFTYNPAFVASLCIGNAIALSECGDAARVVVVDSGNGEREVCAKLEEACKRLMALGVKAVPFSEMCACASLV
jgi:hypothetical protein